MKIEVLMTFAGLLAFLLPVLAFGSTPKRGMSLFLEGTVLEANKEEVVIKSSTGNYTIDRKHFADVKFRPGEWKKLDVEIRSIILITDSRPERR